MKFHRRIVHAVVWIGVFFGAFLLAMSGTLAQTDLAGDDFFGFGGSVEISGHGFEDVFALGGTLTLLSPVAGTAHLLGISIATRSAVGGSVYATGQDIRIGADIERRLYAAGDTVNIETGTMIGRGLRVVARAISLGGSVTGASQLAARRVDISGTLDGDVDILTQRLSFGPNAVINGNLNYSAPAPAEIPDSVVITGTVNHKKTLYRDLPDIGTGMDRVHLFWDIATLILAFAAGGFLAVLFPRFVAAAARQAAAKPGPCLLAGLVGLGSLMVASFILVITFIGGPFAMLSGLALALLVPLGYLLGAYGVFAGLFALLARRPPERWPVMILGFALTLVALKVIGNVPYFGWLAGALVTLLGAGAAVLLWHQTYQRD